VADGIEFDRIGRDDSLSHATDSGTFTYGGIQGGVFSGQFQGARMSGTFQVRPTQGDRVTSPMTKLHQSAKSTLR
jgi:hypothetical protein